jgi:hypothetical protein
VTDVDGFAVTVSTEAHLVVVDSEDCQILLRTSRSPKLVRPGGERPVFASAN